jgi:hypothetical protein
MTMLEVKNVLTGEIATVMFDTEDNRRLSDRIVMTLRRNDRAAKKPGSEGWTVIERSKRKDVAS